MEDQMPDIPQSRKIYRVVYNGRKCAVYGQDYEDLLANACRKFKVESLTLTCEDNTEVDAEYFPDDLIFYARDTDFRPISPSFHSSDIEYPNSCPTSPVSSCGTSTSEIGESPKLEKVGEIVLSIIIPWQKFPKTVMKDMENEKILDKKQRLSVVQVLFEEICDMKLTRHLLRKVATKVINRYPVSFAKYIDGNKVSDGVLELTSSLEYKRDNANRKTATAVLIPKKKSKLEAVMDEKVKDLEGIKDFIEQMKLKEVLTEDDTRMLEYMMGLDLTFTAMKKEIDGENTISNIIDAWPYLFRDNIFVNYFCQLTGFDLNIQSDKYMETISHIYQYVQMNRVLPEELDDQNLEPSWIFILLAAEFSEDITQLVICQNSLKKDKLPCTPITVAIGPSMLNATRYVLLVDKTVIFDHLSSLWKAIILQFAAFYVFDICYPKKASKILECFQRFVLKIKSPNEGKIDDKILTFIKDVAISQI